MSRTYSAEELAAESDVAKDRIEWLVSIGILRPPAPGRFTAADAFRAKMISALLTAGFTPQQISWATAHGHLNLDHVDNYVFVEPAPPSSRTVGDLGAAEGGAMSRLPDIYKTLGLPEPDPGSPIDTDEETMWEAFFATWRLATDDDTPFRAARLMAEGTRLIAVGWPKLLEEQVAGPARDRFLSGEVERYPPEVIESARLMINFAPRMMAWLGQRYTEQLIISGIVDGFEAILAANGMVAPPGPAAPPAVVFADLSGYTRLTEEHGDEAAVRLATGLQERAEDVAAARSGALVKLIGDGAMLRFDDAHAGVEAALDLVGSLRDEVDVDAHAGVHVGPIVERDRDLFGRTVNLASRIVGVAGPGEVVVSEEVARSVDDPALAFEAIDPTALKGFSDPVPLFRVLRPAGSSPSREVSSVSRRVKPS